MAPLDDRWQKSRLRETSKITNKYCKHGITFRWAAREKWWMQALILNAKEC